MDGAKLATDTTEFCKEYGRKAYCKGRSISVRRCGPYCNENPGESRI